MLISSANLDDALQHLSVAAEVHTLAIAFPGKRTAMLPDGGNSVNHSLTHMHYN